jgi:hypothetical protein
VSRWLANATPNARSFARVGSLAALFDFSMSGRAIRAGRGLLFRRSPAAEEIFTNMVGTVARRASSPSMFAITVCSWHSSTGAVPFDVTDSDDIDVSKPIAVQAG